MPPHSGRMALRYHLHSLVGGVVTVDRSYGVTRAHGRAPCVPLTVVELKKFDHL